MVGNFVLGRLYINPVLLHIILKIFVSFTSLLSLAGIVSKIFYMLLLIHFCLHACSGLC